MMLTGGNSKLKETARLNDCIVLGFTLPRVLTCPEAGECKEFCYGKAGMYCMPNPFNHAHANLNATKRADFVDAMHVELAYHEHQARLKGKKLWVRLHDLGDFYSLEYALKWKELIHSFSNVNFYAYSTSLKILDEAGMLGNTHNWCLIPSYSTASKNLLPKNFAYVLAPNAKPLPNSIVGTDDDILNVVNYGKGYKVALMAHGSFKNKAPIIRKAGK